MKRKNTVLKKWYSWINNLKNVALVKNSDCLILVCTEYLYTSLTVNIFFLSQIIWINFGYLATALYIAYNVHENNELEVFDEIPLT